MSTAQTTPGPWSIGRSADGTPLIMVPVPISEGSGFGVATINRPPRMSSVRGDMEANARLIAATPDMYAALKRLDESGLLETLSDMDAAMMDDGDDPIAKPHIDAIRAALAKADPTTTTEGE